MTVSSFTSLIAGIERNLSTRNARAASSVNALVSGARSVPEQNAIADVSVAVGLQNQAASLRAASINLSRASSLLQVADSGAEQIDRALGRLQTLSQRATGGDISAAERTALNNEFQTVRTEITRIVNTTRFGSQTLLDGSFNAQESTENFDIPDVSDAALFGDASLDITSPNSARDAQTTVTAARAELGALQGAFSYALGAFESATQNQEAARSSLSDTDILLASTTRASDAVGQQASLSLLAQANRLPTSVLQLIGG
jgi:flagellin